MCSMRRSRRGGSLVILARPVVRDTPVDNRTGVLCQPRVTIRPEFAAFWTDLSVRHETWCLDS
jgi:hypothetical protein